MKAYNRVALIGAACICPGCKRPFMKLRMSQIFCKSVCEKEYLEKQETAFKRKMENAFRYCKKN